ncbi:alcohol dehydrogenase [Colletotrichum camelliae]|nr:alcohol dehydrogenase [Colletotrichum camelliae]
MEPSVTSSTSRSNPFAKSDASIRYLVSIDVGLSSGDHRDTFMRALSNILATEIAEITFTQIIDGLPLTEVAQDCGNASLPNDHPDHDMHQQLCSGVIEKTHRFRDEFDSGTIHIDSKLINDYRAASLGSRAFKVRLIELVAIAVHQIAVQIFKLDTSLHKEDGIASWKPPKNDLFWEFCPEGAWPTLFRHEWYHDHDQYPNGIADMVGYWAESRIFGGVVLFDRRSPESASDVQDDSVWFHPDREDVTNPDLSLLPILGDEHNTRREDPEEPIENTGIYRDPWERKPLSPEAYDQRSRDVWDSFDYPLIMSFKSEAIVARGPISEGKWAIEPVTLRDLRDDEVLVEIVASGICHTDLHCGNTPADAGVPGVYYPRVLGHEGSGYVVNVGNAVTHVKPGDPVLLSFSYCGSCHVCKTGPPSHCTNFFEINFIGEPVFSDGIGGRFFGQSSLAHHTVVSDKSVVNVAGLGLSRDDLRILAPLGCGLQTGSGTVINVAKAGPEDCVTIAGMGGVGLAAVIAAKNQGCKAIIGIDRLESRLELAKSLGATHIINTTGVDMKQVTEKIKEAAEGLGSTISIDTSAYPPLLAAQIDGTRYMGKIIQVGTGMPESNISIHMQTFMVSGKQYFGAVQGHVRTRDYVPQMVQWWRDGKFPVEKLVKVFEHPNFEQAVEAMKKGDVVKPIIAWS